MEYNQEMISRTYITVKPIELFNFWSVIITYIAGLI